MKTRILMYSLVALFSFGCSSDPCEDPFNVDCATGDADGDGIINSKDTTPTDPCLPEDNLACPTGDLDGDGIINSLDSNPLDTCDAPAIELNIIGTWSYPPLRTIEFVDDGTYKDIDGQILSFEVGNEVVEKKWWIENENTLVVKIINVTGQSAIANFVSKTNECDEMTFVLSSFELVLTRL